MSIYLREHYEDRSAAARANEFRLLGLVVSIAVFSVVSTIVVDLAVIYRTVSSGIEQVLTNGDDSASERSQ
jgi:hypothetical protein